MEVATRKLQKMSKYNYSVVIPKNIIEKYGWNERQKLSIKDKGRRVDEIKDWRKS